jgi:hypothetical protein
MAVCMQDFTSGHCMHSDGVVRMPSLSTGKTVFSRPKHSGYLLSALDMVPGDGTGCEVPCPSPFCLSVLQVFIFAVQLSDVTVVCKTEIGVVSYDEVLVNSNPHDPAGVDQLPGDEFVFTGRPWLP